ncbi:hypothetical protein G9A89_001151 [Geosiphon pyriformis]|nr:hypothetical protein G9A89_001151 [Geosiphon pyriformis]
MKKTIKVSGSESGFKAVALKKKRKGSVLAEGINNRGAAAKASGVCSWDSETGNTIESESVDIEKECLVEKTSFDYGEDNALAGGDHDQTPTNSKVKTKKTLGKPLGKIDFLKGSDDDGVLSDALLELSPPMKNLVNVLVRKSFALDIGLDKVAGKSSQEKLVVMRKLFFESMILEKWMIRATFTSESSLIKATDKAANAKILVNTDLKKSSRQSDWAVVIKEIPIGTSAETVHAALSEFGVVKQKAVVEFEQSDQADLVATEWFILIGKDAVCVTRADSDKKAWDARDQHRVLLYILLMGTNTHDIWDFVRSVGEKTCIIDRHSVTYTQARCAVVCFNFAKSLNATVETTPVLKNANLRWFYLISTKCAKYEKLGHMSLGCVIGGKFFSGNLLRRAFSDTDKSRLAAIYAKCSAPVACPVFFGGLSWAKVARRFSSLPLSSQNVLVNVGFSSEMKPSLPVTIEVNNRFTVLERSLTSLAEQVSKLAKRLNALRPIVPQPSSGCQPLVTLSSQDQGTDVVMSKGSGVFTSGGTVMGAVSFDMSLVSKLEDSMKCLMEMVLGFSAKVDSIDSGHLGMGVAVIMNVSLACHLYKVSEVPGRLLSVKLLFKGKLSVLILGLYAGAFSAVQFSQADKINSFIVKAVNKSSFIVLGSDFNEDSSHKCASFRKCLDLGLANSLVGSPAVKLPTWTNSRGVRKTIDYVIIFSNLVNAIVHCSVLDVGEHFETNHQAVSVSLGLGGLLDVQLNSLHKQNKFKGATAANATMFSEDFIVSQQFSDLDVMKRRVVPDVPDVWYHQYWSLDYVFDEAFSGVMQPIKFLELFGVVSNLPIGKAAGLSGISNEL